MIDEKDLEVISQSEMEALKGGYWVYIEEYDEKGDIGFILKNMTNISGFQMFDNSLLI